jgi:ribosomal protein S12 methylthiotransferase
MSKIFIETVGCPKNREDSERMAGLLRAARHEIVFDAAQADVVVVNTCGFIEAAKTESIETIFDLAPLRDEGKKLIVTGCLTQRYAEELFEELPEADALLGVNDYGRLPEILEMLQERTGSASAGDALAGLASAGVTGTSAGHGRNALRRAGVRVLAAGGAPGVLEGERFALEPRTVSYLKIAEGCDNCCAYCIIPRIRGPYRSVPLEMLIREAALLTDEGCKELILIAQDVTGYGMDLYGESRLPELVRALCRTDGIEWIRLLYCYEERITDELIAVMAEEPKVCKYIDIPLQHVSEPVLRRMGRRSTPRSIRATIGKLRAAMPEIVIRTTFITGFPGETEADFAALRDFVEEQRFGRLGVFAYSREEGTPAAEFPDQVPQETAEARLDALMRIQMDVSLAENERLVGSVQEVLAESLMEDGEVWLGRTRGDAPEIDNAVMFTAPGIDASVIMGRIVKVRVTDAMDYDLVGEMPR